MAAPITPDERAAMRERARNLRDLALNAEATPMECTYVTDVLRLLNALDTAEEFGIGDWRVTTWAYEQVSVAREAHQRRAERAEAEVARLLAERTAAHADDATCASCTHEYVADMERRVEESEAKVERQRGRLRAREEQVRRLRAEVTRLHALVADLRAATSPAWDEDAAALAVFERSHEPSFEDSEEGMREAKRFVLSLLPGRSEAEVQAEALRDAAETYERTSGTSNGTIPWLRARADRLAAEGGADRG